MGKRMFEEGEVARPNDPYKADVYVLTHEKARAPIQNDLGFTLSMMELKVHWTKQGSH